MTDNFTPYPDCTNGEVSLVGGSSLREGRVEICVNGTWVTVCETSFDANNAVVICNQLGYPGLGLLVLKGRFHSLRKFNALSVCQQIILTSHFNSFTQGGYGID